MLAGARRWPLDLPGSAAETRGGTGLHHPFYLDESTAMPVAGMFGRLFHAQYRCKAHVAAFHDLAPLVPGLAFEELGQALFERGPRGAIHLVGQLLALKPG